MTDTDIRIKRALYRANHRGTKEMDFILGRFADAQVRALGAADFDAFEALLTMPDQPIQSWLNGDEPPAEMKGIIEAIRSHHGIAH